MPTPATIIQQKRDGKPLDREQIFSFIQGLMSGEFTDYQASALLMATYFRGMELKETVALTEAMLRSGERYDLSEIPGSKVDKHSTGGIGDKVSLILAPLAAACGLKVPMMSGRGLGNTGGTLDKLESISGFDVRLSKARFEEILKTVGSCMIGQSESIAPADRKLYALRDVTGTVESIPLITASILSKKLAEGATALVLDVKVGSGAFMKTKEQARKLARSLIQVATMLDLPTRAVLTDMNQPLGYAVGNALEVIESIEILSGKRVLTTSSAGQPSSSDLKELTIQLCAHMLELGGAVRKLTEGRKLAHAKLSDGSAWEVFQAMIEAQGGDLKQILDPTTLPRTENIFLWKAKKRGYITKINTENMGRIVLEMGGGRKKTTDSIDPAVGLVFHRKLGARVAVDDPIVAVHAPRDWSEKSLRNLEELFWDSIDIASARKPVPKLIMEVLA